MPHLIARHRSLIKYGAAAAVVALVATGVSLGVAHSGSRAASADTPVVSASCASPSYDGTNFSISCTIPQATTTATVTTTTTATVTPSPTTTSPSSTSTTPTPTPSGFPSAATTGVPDGVTLTAYTGPLTITKCGVVISNATINGSISVAVGNGTHSASTPCVTITNSKINGVVGTASSTGADGPLVLNHVEVSAPTNSNVQAVALSNFYLDSVNVHGGANGGVECYGYCSISNSWIHDFYNAGSTHYDGIISNGTSGNPLVIDHNTVGCNFYASASGANGGCSADLGLFGDFGTISNVTVSNNLFLASPTSSIPGSTSAFCMYGGDESSKKFPTSSNVVVTGNTFQRGPNKKCGLFGAIADMTISNGNAWSSNVWDDGTVLQPS